MSGNRPNVTDRPRYHAHMPRAARVLTFACLALACLAPSARTGEPAAPSKHPSRNLAILLFNGVQIIDYTGPYEVFGHVYAFDQPVPFNTYTVAERTTAITTAMGMSVNPRFSLDEAPPPDVIIVPGGNVSAALESRKVLDWLTGASRHAEIVMSVCNGAFILAQAGLLDGLEATTTAFLTERLRAAAPRTRINSGVRFVDNGKIITTAGLSSGIDGSLHVIERLYGRGTAQAAALSMEYNWDPNSTYARGALADKYLPNQFNIESVAKTWVPVRREGGLDHWQSQWTVTSGAVAADLMQHVEEAFAHPDYFPRAPRVSWQKLGETRSADELRSVWRFSDEAGAPWDGAVSVKRVGAEGDTYLVTVGVTEASPSK
jgi:putative intracellular protease/amidase